MSKIVQITETDEAKIIRINLLIVTVNIKLKKEIDNVLSSADEN